AWHTRAKTVHVVLSDTPSARLTGLASLAAVPPFKGQRALGAELMVAGLEGPFGAELVEETLEELTRRFDYVLVQFPVAASLRSGAGRVRLGLFGSPGGGFAVEHGMGDRGGSRGSGERVVQAPELFPAEMSWLAQGLLPRDTAAGAAVEKLARELA